VLNVLGNPYHCFFLHIIIIFITGAPSTPLTLFWFLFAVWRYTAAALTPLYIYTGTIKNVTSHRVVMETSFFAPPLITYIHKVWKQTSSLQPLPDTLEKH
jgi:hypothetical protein